jgi:Tfp pilus assembly protein PilF
MISQLTKYSENDVFLFKLAAVYDRLNLLDDAVQAYQHALKLEPTNGIGWANLGATLVKLKRSAEAKDAARQAVKQSPDCGPAWALLGKLYSEENRYADAADAFQKAAQLMPKDAEFWRSLAASYSKMNEPVKSQDGLRVFGEKQKVTKRQKSRSDEFSETSAHSATPVPPPIQSSQNGRPVYVVVAPASRGLHIRSKAKPTSAIIVTLRRGDFVFVENGRIRNNHPPTSVVWQKVTTANGHTGWINADYVAPKK